MDNQLTEEQINNWRNVLVGMLGPYALTAPAEEIQAFRDRFQLEADVVAAMKEDSKHE